MHALLVTGFLTYMAPTLVLDGRTGGQTPQKFVTANKWVGWTVVGRVGLMAWAITRKQR